MTKLITFDTIDQKITRNKRAKGMIKGALNNCQYRLYNKSCITMPQLKDGAIALTVTSPPYWNAIDYNLHAKNGNEINHRQREYNSFGSSFADYLSNIKKVFSEVYRATLASGFCCIVVGTLLHKRKHYPIPMLITQLMTELGWEFHQDIIWNKVTGGVRRAGSYIQKPYAGYYYPNIMTEYILIFKKGTEARRDNKKALEIDTLFTQDIANNVWHIAPVPPNQINHPCAFPQELARRLILLYSQEEDEILDPFVGSGQTSIEALENQRHFVGYDIEEAYIKLTHARLNAPYQKRRYNLLPKYEKISM